MGIPISCQENSKNEVKHVLTNKSSISGLWVFEWIFQKATRRHPGGIHLRFPPLVWAMRVICFSMKLCIKLNRLELDYNPCLGIRLMCCRNSVVRTQCFPEAKHTIRGTVFVHFCEQMTMEGARKGKNWRSRMQTGAKIMKKCYNPTLNFGCVFRGVPEPVFKDFSWFPTTSGEPFSALKKKNYRFDGKGLNPAFVRPNMVFIVFWRFRCFRRA